MEERANSQDVEGPAAEDVGRAAADAEHGALGCDGMGIRSRAAAAVGASQRAWPPLGACSSTVLFPMLARPAHHLLRCHATSCTDARPPHCPTPEGRSPRAVYPGAGPSVQERLVAEQAAEGQRMQTDDQQAGGGDPTGVRG